jgi:hypothetical protein
MTPEVRKMLEEKAHWYETNGKKIWQPEELLYTYQIFNLHFGENRQDTGCGSCRRSVVNHVRKLYQNMGPDTSLF